MPYGLIASEISASKFFEKDGEERSGTVRSQTWEEILIWWIENQ